MGGWGDGLVGWMDHFVRWKSMDGWMDGWDSQMDGWMDGQFNTRYFYQNGWEIEQLSSSWNELEKSEKREREEGDTREREIRILRQINTISVNHRRARFWIFSWKYMYILDDWIIHYDEMEDEDEWMRRISIKLNKRRRNSSLTILDCEWSVNLL